MTVTEAELFPKMTFQHWSIGKNVLSDDFQPYQMCSVEDLDKEGIALSERTGGHTPEAVDSSKYLGVTKDDLSWWIHFQNTVSNANRTLGFLQTCEGLHKASVRPHIQGYDLSNYGVFLNFLGPSPTNSNHSTGAGAETSGSLCL